MSGILIRKRYMIVLNNMKLVIAIFVAVLVTGCATNDYAIYVDAQKALSKDNTMNETARISALIEMTKNSDPAVRATGIMLLQQLQSGSKNVIVEPPKKNILGF